MEQENRVAFLTWEETGERLKAGAAAILPIGAAAKEHGLHMPMNTDQIQAEYFAGQIAEEINALIWPTVIYGFYPAFVAYSGSASLTFDTFKTMIEEILSGILRYNPAKVLVLNTGISTIAPVNDALASKEFCDRVCHLTAYSGPQYMQATSNIRERDEATHADEIETSVMLAIAPEKVTISKAEAAPAESRIIRGPLTPFDPASPNFSPSGSCGDPTRATEENGRILLKAIISDIVEEAKKVMAA